MGKKVKKARLSRMGIHPETVKTCPACGNNVTFHMNAKHGEAIFDCKTCGWEFVLGESLEKRLERTRKIQQAR